MPHARGPINDQKKWATFHNVPVSLRPDLRTLKRRLCRIAGSRFQINWVVNQALDKAFVKWLQTIGTFFPGKPFVMRKGEPCLCHDNSERLTTKKPARYLRYKGLALSDDGIWRIHSWVMGPEGMIETTEQRELYFAIPIPKR